MIITPIRVIIVVAVAIVVTISVVIVVRHDSAVNASDKRLTEFHPVPETRDEHDILKLLEPENPKQNPAGNK